MHQPQLIRTFTTARDPVELPQWEIESLQTFGDAVAHAMQRGKKTLDRTADAIGMKKSQLCEITKNKKHFPMGKARDFSAYVGNLAVQQWVAWDAGFQLARRPESADEKLVRLERENAALRQQASHAA
jgi:plasmid maintenance system antidote protein VapI